MEGMGMGAMNATADNAGHDHSAHASQADMSSHDKYHGSVLRRPDGSYYYAHGGLEGESGAMRGLGRRQGCCSSGAAGAPPAGRAAAVSWVAAGTLAATL